MSENLPDERPQRRREYSGASSTLGLAAVIVLALGFGLWFFQFRDSGNSSGGDAHGAGIVALPDSLNSTGKAAAAEDGRAAPDFRLPGLDDQMVQLSSYRGEWVLLNFWASWCGPCRGETPDLQAFYEQHAPDGFTVIGVNQQEERGAAKSFTDQFGVTYPILLDHSGGVSAAYRTGRGLPVTYLIDPGGVIQKTFLGRISQDDLAKIAAGEQP